MTKSVLFCGVALTAIPFLVSAKDFPLEFKTLDAEAALAFPGVLSVRSRTTSTKPAAITKTPPAVSRRPLYGQLLVQPTSASATVRTSSSFRLSGPATGYWYPDFWYRFDESQGDGKGYDQLIVDLNRNGDLTDDAVIARVSRTTESESTSQRELGWFGPIVLPNDPTKGAWRPAYLAQLTVYTFRTSFGFGQQPSVSAYLYLKPASYLEATVDFDGVARKVGVLDANCNFRFGDVSTFTSLSSTVWSFSGGDYFLHDGDGNGKFGSSVWASEIAPFGSILYVGAKPYKAALAADGKSLSLEPWSEPLAELELPPKAESVSSVQLAWEYSPCKWQLLRPGIENGKVKVPAGYFYRLYSCTVKARTSTGDLLVLTGYKRSGRESFKAEAGATTQLKCGEPIEVGVTSTRTTIAATSATVESPSLVRRLFPSLDSGQSPVQRIAATVLGAGGEQYASFILQGRKGEATPQKPTFTVITTDSKQVASGNLEFG